MNEIPDSTILNGTPLNFCKYDYELCSNNVNWFLMLPMFPLLCILGTFFGLTMVSYTNDFVERMFRENHEYQEKNRKNFIKKQLNDIKYEYKFLYDAFIVRIFNRQYESFENEDENINENTSIIEDTPNGKVIMTYDNEMKRFNYWSTKKIPHNVLESVARKFTHLYQCYNIYNIPNHIIPFVEKYYDPHDYIGDYVAPFDETEESDDEEVIKEKQEIDLEALPPLLREKAREKMLKEQKAKEEDKNKEPEMRQNTFITKGTINDYEFIQKNKYSNKKSKGDESMSFASFKKYLLGQQI